MVWHTHNQAQLDTLKREKDAILILFGGENCGVCQTIKPQINANFSDKFPALTLVYIAYTLVALFMTIHFGKNLLNFLF
jgi:thiol-disulfide isomerase/thioredoxin